MSFTRRISFALTAVATIASAPSLAAQGLGNCRFKIPSDAKLIGYGVYEGSLRTNLKVETHGNRLRAVRTFLGKQDGPVFLVLTSYEPVVWDIVAEPGQRIAGVLAMGYYAQVVANVPKGVPMAFSTHEDGTGLDCPKPLYLYGMKDPKFEQLQASLQGRLGRSMSDFHGSYGAECLPRGCNAKALPVTGDAAKPGFWGWFFGVKASAPPRQMLNVRASTQVYQ